MAQIDIGGDLVVILEMHPLNVDDLIIHRSNQSGIAPLSVNIHEFPANAPSVITPERDVCKFLLSLYPTVRTG